ncbi:MAG: hypothetical protein VR74_00590 [Hyphomonas sp. BRH_c22]|uniref:hypothetical protein n=1 Tax=Hyphomonas sp. BRH_c22 TaxID=1629710 RepID=UPI0005F1B512|nr:hypothetical protein [Hyphomonas sp. BRH_c22]KJS39722.1 MAG: hypothetical protein VR74_00590 [Hyphomonas sp. BRH_c22]
MILQRLATSIPKQDWFTVAVETLIVVFGVFIGLQVNNWNTASQERAREGIVLEQRASEFTMAVEEGKRAQVEAEASLAATRDVLKAIWEGEEPDDSGAFLKTLGIAGGFEPAPAEPVTLVELMPGGGLSDLSSPDLRTALIRYHETALYQRELSSLTLQRVSAPHDGFHDAIHVNPDFSPEPENRLERYDWALMAGTRQQFQTIMYGKPGLSYGIAEQIVRGQAVLEEIEKARE